MSKILFRGDGIPKKLPQILNLEEFGRILRHTNKNHHKLAFKLGFLCGLRVSEIVKLTPADVDRGRGELFIRNAKGGRDRYVPIPPPLTRNLRHLPIGCGVRALEIAFKKAVARAKVNKDVHFHSLRHSAATYYLQKGMDIKKVQRLLGHSSLSITSIYLHTDSGELKKSVEEIWK